MSDIRREALKQKQFKKILTKRGVNTGSELIEIQNSYHTNQEPKFDPNGSNLQVLGELLSLSSELREMMVLEFPNSDVYLQLAKTREQNSMLLGELEEYENKFK